MAETRASVGAGRVLVLVYGFFTLAAGARSTVQIATKFTVAPLAYVLSAVAAVVYIAGGLTVALADRRPELRRLVRVLCTLELAGVTVVGLLSLSVTRLFPDATVWSCFGSGYAFVPLALPLLGLIWAHRARTEVPEFT